MNVAQISFSVSTTVFNAMAKRAGPLNIRPTEYARRLFEAAWTARVAGERGKPTEDRALDHQVQHVFLLADCEPEYIAETLLLPLERVTRILDGWRQAARELTDPPAQTKPETPIPPPMASSAEAEPQAAASDGYDIAIIGRMWAEGISTRKIAAAIGKTEGAFRQWASKHRDTCPRRRGKAG